MYINLSEQRLSATAKQARPVGDTPEEQMLKYKFHQFAHGMLQYYIDKSQYLSAYVLAFSFFEDRIKALAVVKYRDYGKKENFENSINIDLSRLIGNIYKSEQNFIKIIDPCSNEITPIFLENLSLILEQRNKLIHEAMWRPNAISLKDVDILMEAKRIVYSHQRKLMRHLKDLKNV